MKIVIAPDKFKDSLSAIEVCDNLVEGLSNIYSSFDFISCPMADGGEAVSYTHLTLPTKA